ncbi:DNA polymerase I [Mammaliicoccus virus vB_MscM-PMS2]|nr:DNA polymerase I [Mammaliicoccus virus vB_MscM-PMS2]
MKDVLILLDYPRVDHYKEVGNTLNNVYFNTQMGKLLKAVINEYAKIGMDRYGIDYAFTKIPDPLQTKGNKILKYKEPKLTECKEHFQNLKDRIITNKPKIVMPLGKLGCKALINETSITSARGVPVEITLENETGSHTCWVLPTFSIEYVSIKPNLERHVATDFRTLSKFLEQGSQAFESKEVSYELVTTIERVREIFNNDIKKPSGDGYDIVAWDLETNSLRPEIEGSKALVLSMTWANGQGVTIPLYKGDFQWANGQQDIDEILSLMKDWLANKDMQKVGHNIQYDIKFLMLAHDFKILESNQDTKVGWYLAVTQEQAESLRLSNLAYEATDMGGYDKPLENFKVWYKTVLLKFLEKELSSIITKNKDIAKKQHNVNKTDYDKWISEQIDPNKQVELDEQEKRFGVTSIDKQYMDLGLYTEKVNLNMLMDNENFKNVIEQSSEYMTLSEQAKRFTLNNALSQINEHKKATNVRNEIDGGDFNYDWFPLELMHPYASGDTDCCRRIYCDIRDRIKDRPKAIRLLTHDYPRLTRTLAKIEYNGMYVNSEYAKSNDDNYKEELANITKQINEHWSAQEVINEKNKLYMLAVEDFNNNKPKDRDKELLKIRNKYKHRVIDFNPKSGDDKGKLFFDVLGIELPFQKEFLKDKPFQDGKKEKDLVWSDYKTDKKVIEYITEHYPEHKDIMELFLAYSSLSTRQSTFTSMLVENPVNNYVHPTYNSTGTETGRLSSRNPNAQNFPSKTTKVNKFDYKNPIKRAFQTRFDNGGLIQLDYSALEMRIIALYTQDTEMIKSFFDGDDIHKATASIMHKVPVEEVTAEQRQQAKAVNFGLAYGESPFSFAGKNDMSVEEAESIFDQYYSTKPKVKGSIDSVHDFVTKNGYVETMQGHRRNLKGAQVSDLKIKNEAFRQSFNTIIQGTGGYLTNMSLTYIDDYLTKYNLQSKIIATVHDSIVIDCPKHEIENVVKVSRHIMENLPFDFLKLDWNGEKVQFPITSDAEIGLTYNDVVEYDADEFKTFNSVKGYTKYHGDLNKVQHTYETKLISEEQKDQLQDKIKSQKELYQKI